MENLLRVSDTHYPDGTHVKYLKGFKPPRLLPMWDKQVLKIINNRNKDRSLKTNPRHV